MFNFLRDIEEIKTNHDKLVAFLSLEKEYFVGKDLRRPFFGGLCKWVRVVDWKYVKKGTKSV